MAERITFVVEFEGDCPRVSAGTEILGGRLIAVSFEDLEDTIKRARSEGYQDAISHDCDVE